MGAYKLCNIALSITVLLRERLRTNKQNNISIAVFNYCLNYYEQELCFYFNKNVEVEVKTSRLFFWLAPVLSAEREDPQVICTIHNSAGDFIKDL